MLGPQWYKKYILVSGFSTTGVNETRELSSVGVYEIVRLPAPSYQSKSNGHFKMYMIKNKYVGGSL